MLDVTRAPFATRVLNPVDPSMASDQLDTPSAERPRRFRWRRAVLGAMLVMALLGAAVYEHGHPIGVGTWLAFGAITALGAAAGLPGRWRHVWLLGLFVAANLVVPDLFLYRNPLADPYYWIDVRGGRQVTEVAPGIWLGGAGENTVLIEHYLGPVPAQWQMAYPRSPHVRDGDDRVDAKNIIHHVGLADTLAMLPGDDARRRALICLTDPANRLRVHQSLLLVALKTLGYPDGLDAESWWRAHSDLFRAESDPVAAARVVVGWRAKIEESAYHRLAEIPRELSRQFRAARYHEQGSWGRDYEFGEAYRELPEARREFRYQPGEGEQPVPSPPNIVWWE